MSLEEFKSYLDMVVEKAFREGALWQKCGGEETQPMSDAIKMAQIVILECK